ncbi:MAG: hypothetical protein HKN12_02815, partial [Gemmatimonadetes bacterium]|nr:hypothetical protein [Gemmatimonadota bacterium]
MKLAVKRAARVAGSLGVALLLGAIGENDAHASEAINLRVPSADGTELAGTLYL